MSVDIQSMTKEEKDKIAEQKMAIMREKNEELLKRYKEVEADKRYAEETNSSITTLIHAKYFDSKPTEQKRDHYDDWKEERKKIDEDRIAHVANHQREWDMNKSEQSDRSKQEGKFGRNEYRKGKSVNHGSIWSKNSDNMRNEREQRNHNKYYASDARSFPPRNKKSFSPDQCSESINKSQEFNFRKDRIRKINSGVASQIDSAQRMPKNTHVGPKVFERTNKTTSERSSHYEYKTPYQMNKNYSNRDFKFDSSYRSITKVSKPILSQHHSSYDNGQLYNATLQHVQKMNRSGTWPDDGTFKAVNKARVTDYKIQPKRNAFKDQFSKGNIRQNSHGVVHNNEESLSKTYSLSNKYHATNLKGEKKSYITEHSSGTWSDEENVESTNDEPGNKAKSFFSYQNVDNFVEVSTDHSGTWSDCEQDTSKAKDDKESLMGSFHEDCSLLEVKPQIDSFDPQFDNVAESITENTYGEKNSSAFSFDEIEQNVAIQPYTNIVGCELLPNTCNMHAGYGSFTESEESKIDQKQALPTSGVELATATPENISGASGSTYESDSFSSPECDSISKQVDTCPDFVPNFACETSNPLPIEIPYPVSFKPDYFQDTQEEIPGIDQCSVNTDLSLQEKKNPYDLSDDEYDFNYWEDVDDNTGLVSNEITDVKEASGLKGSVKKRKNLKNKSGRSTDSVALSYKSDEGSSEMNVIKLKMDNESDDSKSSWKTVADDS